MKIIDCSGKNYEQLNEEIRKEKEVELVNCEGQRFIGCGTENKTIVVNGVPGNGLASFMSGGNVVVRGNAQDQICDTMNDGKVVIHGSVGDAAGYARYFGMRIWGSTPDNLRCFWLCSL